MTTGAIFRNCGESLTSTAHSSRLRDANRLYTWVESFCCPMVGRHRTLYQLRSCLLWNGSCPFLIFFHLSQHLIFFSSIDETKWQYALILYQLDSQDGVEIHSHINGESETSVEENFQSIDFSSAGCERKSSWLLQWLLYFLRIFFFLALQFWRER